MRKALYLLALLLFSLPIMAQELNCQVQINTQQAQNIEKKMFETLKKDIQEFMNTRKWTQDQYLNQERIECTILIDITEAVSSDEFKANIQVQSRRPVYKSSYNSSIFIYKDADFTFKYVEFQPLEYNDATFTTNLTSVLAFYAYVIIGEDYDSFSPEGGSMYFQKAQNVINNAQNTTDKGWRAFESQRNRYWIADNLLSPQFKPMRQAKYKYHRLGLDEMTGNKESARAAIAESLDLLKQVYSNKPGSLLMQIFFNAKADELVNIFTQSFPEEKTKVLNILNEIDPVNSSKYQAMTRDQ